MAGTKRLERYFPVAHIFCLTVFSFAWNCKGKQPFLSLGSPKNTHGWSYSKRASLKRAIFFFFFFLYNKNERFNANLAALQLHNVSSVLHFYNFAIVIMAELLSKITNHNSQQWFNLQWWYENIYLQIWEFLDFWEIVQDHRRKTVDIVELPQDYWSTRPTARFSSLISNIN